MKSTHKRLRFLWASLLATALAGGCGGGSGSQDNTSSSVPVPSIEAITAGGTTFNASPVSLEAANYSEKEFYVRGTASRYRISNPMTDAEVIDSGHPYTTRVVVRAPTDPAKFNGTVVVEWLNVTTGQDVDFVFGATHDLITREGYAYVGVTAQRVGAQTLRRWNSTRYGIISLDAPNVDPKTGTDIDPAGGVGGVQAGGDVLAWDVMSQIGQALKKGSSTLLPGLQVRRVLAAGESQSAVKLERYHNTIHPLHKVYEGFLLYDRGAQLRADVGVKVLSVGTEFAATLAGPPQADDADNRWWELAGASHVSLAELTGYIDPSTLRDGVFRNGAGTAISLTNVIESGNCATLPLWSQVPNGPILSAALSALSTWVGGGQAPASVPRYVYGSGGVFERGTDNRVVGGLRTALFDVPRAMNLGTNSGSLFCQLAGSSVNFSDAEMCSRYGSPANYLAQFRALTDQNVTDRVMLRPDADRLIAEASAVTFSCAP